jgi:hypothetical protein
MQMKSCAAQTGLLAAVFLSEAAPLLCPEKTCPSSSIGRCLQKREDPATHASSSTLSMDTYGHFLQSLG